MAAMKTASRQEAAASGAEVMPTGMRRMAQRYNGSKAYRWWAVIGGITLAMFAVQFALWIGSGNFKPTPNGATEVPTYMRVAVRCLRSVERGHLLLAGLPVHRPPLAQGASAHPRGV